MQKPCRLRTKPTDDADTTGDTAAGQAGCPIGRAISVLVRHAVAHARLGAHDLRFGGVAFDLLPELADEDAQVVQVVGVGGAPDGGQQRAVGDDTAGVAGKEEQEVVLLRRQMHRLAGARDQPLDRVDAEAIDLGDGRDRIAPAPVAQGGADAGGEFADAKGFST